ncbi:uncharacterized protein TNCV_2543141 [Trichonephila clavipes]|nr:uncharacterized protein TNCV_2543141 [Trichonephila clavipes]
MKIVVCRWVPHNPTEHEKEKRVKIGKETRKLLNGGGHRIISKIVTGDEMYIPFFDVPTRQENKVLIFEDDPTPIRMKSNVCRFLQKYGISQSHQVGRTQDRNTGLTVEFLKQRQIKVIEHPPYSLDLAMWDFWLFFNLKKNLLGRRFHSEEIDVATNAFFSSIQRNKWFEAFNL